MFRRVLIVVIIGLFVNACETTGRKDGGASVDERSTGTGAEANPAQTGDGITTYGASEDRLSAEQELNTPGGHLSTRVIYFDYDSTTILPQFNDAIQAHADLLQRYPELALSLEGHADERGSREYNLALGERRAKAVKKQLMVLGASSTQTRTTSYGEERPVATGHDEQSWAENRRVEIIYR